MVSLTLLAAVAAVDVCPKFWVIDFGPAAIPFKYKMQIELVARDGTALELPVEWAAGADAKGNRSDTVIFLKLNGWVGFDGPGATLTVVGTEKKSPVRFVRVKSDVAFPTVRWVPRLPDKK